MVISHLWKCVYGSFRIFCLAFLAVYSISSAGSEGFWQIKANEKGSGQVQLNDHQQVMLAQNFDASVVGANSVTQLGFQQLLGEQSQFVLQLSNTRDERNAVLGFTQNNLSVSYMSGSGEDFSRVTQDYAGVDPYLFHGGWSQSFNYAGYALDYRLGGFGNIQYGQATITSDSLQDRKAQYVEWSNNALFARFTQMNRGVEKIGYGVDAGVAFDNKRLAFQSMQLDNERSLNRLRLNFQRNDAQQFWLDLSAHKNDLFKQDNDYRMMLTFQTRIGKQSVVNSHNESSSNAEHDHPQGDHSKAKWRRGLYIGAGVVTAAALSSSGSENQDDAVRSKAQDDAAFEVLNRINPKSVSENREYGGYIYMNGDGSFSATPEVRGEAASLLLPAPGAAVPAGSVATASYHTHAAFDPRYDNENFSPVDLEGDRAFNLDGYLGTPLGFLKLHNVRTGVITTLGRINK